MAIDPIREPSETEARLVESALRCFSRKGFAGASIREIIEDAGVTRPVLYYYFKNKEDLFRHLVESEFDRFHEGIEAICATHASCRGRLKALTAHSFSRAEERLDWCKLLIQFFLGADASQIIEKDAMVERRYALFARIMAEGIASKELADGDPVLLGKVFAGTIDFQIISRAHGDASPLTETLAHDVVDLFMDGAGVRARRPVQGELPLG